MNSQEMQYKNWYNDTLEKLKLNYGIDYKLIAGLIASTSPRYDVKRNLRISKEIYKDYKVYGENFIYFAENYQSDFQKIYGIMFCHYNNVLKTLKHNFNESLELSGLKVNSFYNNLIGNKNYVTLDSWMMKALKHKKLFINANEYLKYSQLIRKRAKYHKIAPCEYQAIIWIRMLKKHGYRPKIMADMIDKA
jgi:hypothetical protein